jgi:hypothetical protein
MPSFQNEPLIAKDALSQLDSAVKGHIIRTSCVFPKTASLKDAPCTTFLYDGSLEGFRAMVPKVAQSTELAALGAKHTVLEVLAIMCEDANFDALFLASVDGLVLQQTGSHIVHIKNDRSAASSCESSGRSAFLELSNVRTAATMALQSENVKVLHASTPILVAMGIVGIATLSLVLFRVFGKK